MCDLSNFSFIKVIRVSVGEFLGTAILLGVGCMGCIDTSPDAAIINLNEAFTFGIAIVVAVRIFMHLSGGHLNPVITLASVLIGMTSPLLMPFYILSQLLGAMFGFFIFRWLTPDDYLGGETVINNLGFKEKALGTCSPFIRSDAKIHQVLIFETIVTTILVLAWCIIWDVKNKDKVETAIIRFGITYLTLIDSGSVVSKSNMNPFRSLAPAVFNNDWKYHWIFWVGPITGGLIASYTYRFLRLRPKDTLSSVFSMKSMIDL